MCALFFRRQWIIITIAVEKSEHFNDYKKRNYNAIRIHLQSFIPKRVLKMFIRFALMFLLFAVCQQCVYCFISVRNCEFQKSLYFCFIKFYFEFHSDLNFMNISQWPPVCLLIKSQEKSLFSQRKYRFRMVWVIQV